MVSKIAHALRYGGLGHSNFARHLYLVFAGEDTAHGLNANGHSLEIIGRNIGYPIKRFTECLFEFVCVCADVFVAVNRIVIEID